MKKAIAILLSLIMILSLLCACAKTDTTPAADTASAPADTADTAAAPAEEEKIVVAGVVFQDDQFMNMLTQGYKDAAADLGVEILTANSNNDQAKEVELINTYITQGVKGIAIDPLSTEATIATLRTAYEAGVEVALVDQNIPSADFIAAGYCSDNYVNCKLVGDVAAQLIKEKYGDRTIKLAIVQFKSQLPELSQSRVDGYMAALDELGVKYEIVANQDAWLQDMGIEVVGGIITANPDLDVILAMNDGGTIGSAMAVVNAGKSDDIMVFGHDGSDQISSMVLDESNPLQAVVAQDPYTQGYKAIEGLVNAIRTGKVEERGVSTVVPGTVLSITEPDAVNAWRAAQGY